MIMAQVAQQPDIEIVERNLTIRSRTRTLGELDAILWHKQKQEYWHWELTFKHYLGFAEDFWPGPNPTDHFHRKYHRGLEHQFPLAHHPAAQPFLPGPIKHQHLLSRGVLYYPAGYTLPPPAGAHPQHLRGTWWPLEQLPKSSNYLILKKKYWLNAAQFLALKPILHTAESVIRHVHTVNCPTMLLMQHATGELSPGFVVPDNWISNAQARYTQTTRE